MSRYVPTPEEQVAIDLLRLAGYAVIRQRTYNSLQEKVRLAEHQRHWEERENEHVRKWAEAAHVEQRRLADRLNHVYGVARANGATVEELRQPATS